MKLYFTHGFGDNLALINDSDLLYLADNGEKGWLKTSDEFVEFDNKKVKIDDLSEKTPCILNRELIRKLKGKRFHLVRCFSPHEILNYRPYSVECILSDKYYILPNGRKYYTGTKVQNWSRKWGKDKLEFNYMSFMEASKMVEKNELKIKKPKGKSKNPFFDPKVVQGLKKDDTVREVGLVAMERKGEVVKSTLTCDTCQFKNSCPGFMAGSVCGYSENFKYLVNKIKSRDIDLITEAIQEVISSESERYAMAKHFENVSGNIDGRTTQIGDLLFKKLIDFVRLVKPELNQGVTYNILNQQVNIGTAVEKLEDAGLSREQRVGLAEQIDKIIKEEKQKGTTGTKVVTSS